MAAQFIVSSALRAVLLASLLVLLCAPGFAGPTLRMAVAANFSDALAQLVAGYQQRQPDFQASLSSASSGKHYAQLRQGAPFDLFFSADNRRTADLVASGDALAQSRFVYAQGQLVLWSADPERISGDGLALLQGGDFQRLAMANPRLAPYGEAAQALLADAGVRLSAQQQVTGQSIGQAFSFIRSGNAELGLVALSQVIAYEREHAAGSRWLPPPDSYPAIAQEVVQMTAAAGHPWAAPFLDWLRCDPQAHAILREAGYLIPADPQQKGCAGDQ